MLTADPAALSINKIALFPFFCSTAKIRIEKMAANMIRLLFDYLVGGYLPFSPKV